MRGRVPFGLWFVALLLIGAAAAYTGGVAAAGGSVDSADVAVPVLLATLLAGPIALVAWWRERKFADGLAGSADEREREVRAELEEKLDEERRARRNVEKAREAEQNWNRELRREVARFHHEHGALGDWDDLRAAVLRIAMTLLNAEKGLLLSRADGDHDGDLDLVCALGFTNNPEHSKLVQRFAREVIEADTTLRQNGAAAAEAGTPADREISNILAIPIYVRDEFSGVVVCANGDFEEHEDEVLLSLGDHAGALLENVHLHGRLRNSYVATVGMLAEAIEAKDPFLRGHSDEVSDYVAAVAEALDIDPKRREELVFASLLHDVGKIGISERILLKPAALTPEERSIIELHPRIGYRLVQQVPALDGITPAVLHHHERFDGDGYPSRLRGEQIPLEARIVCVADSFSAMTADRPYRGRMSLEDACAELERCAGTQFDPEIVRVFVEAVRKDSGPREPSLLDQALSDPELQARREADEPLLGYGTLAVTDNLTLLYSHRYLHEVTRAEAQRAALQEQGFGLVFVELCDIATVNEAEGYAAGDELIREAARAVQRAAVRCGGTACRYSGRRLALLAPLADQATTERLGAEIASELEGHSGIRVATTTWQPGESGDDVIARVRGAGSEGVRSQRPVGA